MSSKKDCNIFINFLGNSLNVGLQRKIDKINKIKTLTSNGNILEI
jgi:hypothetical protein